MAIWPDRCVALAKKELRYMFSFGLAAILTGTIFIDRLNREKALSTMEETAAGIRNKKAMILILRRVHVYVCVHVLVCTCYLYLWETKFNDLRCQLSCSC